MGKLNIIVLLLRFEVLPVIYKVAKRVKIANSRPSSERLGCVAVASGFVGQRRTQDLKSRESNIILKWNRCRHGCPQKKNLAV
jgi:hypothetical protein